eukprot:750733-Hanusia_phi.AAC.6
MEEAGRESPPYAAILRAGVSSKHIPLLPSPHLRIVQHLVLVRAPAPQPSLRRQPARVEPPDDDLAPSDRLLRHVGRSVDC